MKNMNTGKNDLHDSRSSQINKDKWREMFLKRIMRKARLFHKKQAENQYAEEYMSD